MPTIKELQNLIKNKIPPAEVLASVPETPMVNSFEKKFKNIVSFINLIPSPDRESYFHSLREDDGIIYWKLAENDVGVEIIGIVWDAKAGSKIICGTILPP